ncbi:MULTISPECIES: sulfotransferase family protein [unclassified Streptomyces]|uniref:sulfotransferase family protein n=1 Tax=unclassified Streptomyces TaxID=2593676 RepID=UPI0036E56EFE
MPTREMSGQELWDLFAASDEFLHTLDRDGIKIAEMVPVVESWGGGTATLPRIAIVLALLTDKPRELYDRLALEMADWPRRPARDQLRTLFDWLCRQLGRSRVVERTGLSLVHVPVLRREFPEARFVHIHRDGPDCAMSMSRTPIFRLALLRATAAQRFAEVRGGTRAERARVRAEFTGLVAPPYDVDKVRDYDLPPSAFGEMWSDWMRDGLAELAEIAPDRLLTIRYEDLLSDPRTGFCELGTFIGADITDEWLDAARTHVDVTRIGAAKKLDATQLAELHSACEPGTRALRDFTHHAFR